jgi:hypothetical protein
VFRSGGFIPPLGGKCGEVNSPLPPDSAFSLHPSYFKRVRSASKLQARSTACSPNAEITEPFFECRSAAYITHFGAYAPPTSPHCAIIYPLCPGLKYGKFQLLENPSPVVAIIAPQPWFGEMALSPPVHSEKVIDPSPGSIETLFTFSAAS